jgi:TolA-binding protein
VPDSLYKVGQCLEELKQSSQARQVYDELVKRYPDTAAGTLAAERLAKLKG